LAEEPEVTGKVRIRFAVVVRVVESVFLRKEIANHELPPRTAILPQWPHGKARSGGEPEGRASMGGIRCVRLDRLQGVPSTNPIFVGSVSIQEVVNEALAEILRVTAVTFEDGAVNRPHRHTTDQVLIAASGSGFVATDDDRHPLEPGDVAFIPAGTRHWHGANPDGTFTHLATLTPGHTEIDDHGSA
jgi:quercetin dioxygenase-like cupin family protein